MHGGAQTHPEPLHRNSLTPDEGQDEHRARQGLPERLPPVPWLLVVLTPWHMGQQLAEQQDLSHHGLATRSGRTIHQVGAVLHNRHAQAEKKASGNARVLRVHAGIVRISVLLRAFG